MQNDLDLKIGEIEPDTKLIPQKVAEEKGPEIEDRPFLISFALYKNKLCEIDCLQNNQKTKVLRDIKKIGNKIFDFDKCSSEQIDIFPVENKGEYKKLYNGLSMDVGLKEHKLQRDARIFYFINKLKRIFYIIAIKCNHFETKKVRR